jgi:hypothetical protein
VIIELEKGRHRARIMLSLSQYTSSFVKIRKRHPFLLENCHNIQILSEEDSVAICQEISDVDIEIFVMWYGMHTQFTASPTDPDSTLLL